MGVDARATFAVELEDHTSGTADEAVGALERLREKLKEDQAALNELQAAMRRLQASASVEAYLRQTSALGQLEQQMRRLQSANSVNIEKYRELQARIEAAREAVSKLSKEDSVQSFLAMRDAISAKKQSLASVQSELFRLGGTTKQTTKHVEEASAGFDDLMDVAQGAGGAVEGLAGRAGQLSQALGKTGSAGIVVLAIAVIVALTLAVTAAGIALAGFGLRAANAARDTRLSLEAMLGSASAAKTLAGEIASIEAATGVASGRLTEFARQLQDGGVPAGSMAKALRAVALAEAALGSGEAAKLVEQFKGAKHNAEALANSIEDKFGGLVQRRMLGLDQQFARARVNLGRIFADLEIEPFLKALQGVLRLLDQNTMSGRALKVMMEGLLNPLFSALAKGGPYAAAFFKGMVIGALLVTIAVLRVKKALQEAFGGESKSSIDWLTVAMYAGAASVGAFVGVLVALAALIALAFAPLGLLVLGIAAAVLVLATPFIVVGAAVYGLYLAFRAAYQAIAGLDFRSLATNLISGLAQGIEAGAAWAVNAIKRLADRMMGSIKAALGIASPSKVFALYGRFTAQGLVKGIEAGAPEVDSAVRGLVSIPAVEPPAAAGTTIRNSQRGGTTYNITIHGVKDAQQLRSPSFLAQLAAALEGAAISGGIPLEPETA
jgi:hypothetical protein